MVFNPLGINSFIKNTTLSKITERGTHFDYFGIDFEKCLDAVYKEQEIEKKVDVLNSYFTSKIENFQNDIIEKSLELIHSSDEKINVKYISEKLSIHRRTLLREFNKHLCCGVKTYIDVVKFRKAFTWYQTSDIKPNISSLSYDFNYFDQSEFVKHFKKITKSNPTKLLKEIKHLGNEDTYWKVIN